MKGANDMRFAVIPCPCGERWAVETRHAKVTCPRCGTTADLAARTRLWQGDTALAARDAAGTLRAEAAGAPAVRLAGPSSAPRHDSPADAAAAKANAITNRSDRAEAVALWMTRLVGQPSHADLVAALRKAGLDQSRAEREIVRMLAMDYLMEPRAGSYKVIDA
jgi:hypothetical protein